MPMYYMVTGALIAVRYSLFFAARVASPKAGDQGRFSLSFR